MLEPQKTHPTGEFVCNCGVKWWPCIASFHFQPCNCGKVGRQKFEFRWFFFIILHLAVCVFLFVMQYLMLNGSILFRKGNLFVM